MERSAGMVGAPGVTWTRVVRVGLLVGLLLNFTGWLGNNLFLGAFWAEVTAGGSGQAWRDSIWRDVFSFIPDFIYGVAIAWLVARVRPLFTSLVAPSLIAGLFVSVVGGITTYFAIANSGFISWKLALASFALVLGTKLPLALLAGWMLETGRCSLAPGSA